VEKEVSGRPLVAVLCVFGAWALGCQGRDVRNQRASTRIQARLGECEVLFPPGSTKEAAILLEERAALLGLALSPSETRGVAGRAANEAGGSQRVREALRAYLELLEVPDDAIGEPPELVRRFLDDHSAALDALRGDVPERSSSRSEAGAAPGQFSELPSDIVGHVRLQRLLIAESLRKSLAGEGEVAEKTMAAAWKLNQALVERPSAISQMMAIAITRWQMAALRKMDGLSAEWPERLEERNHRDSYYGSLDCEAMKSFRAAQESEATEAAESIGAILDLTARLRRQDPCAYSSEIARGIFRKALGQDAEAMPNLQEASYRLFRAEVERELTALVLQARQKRAETGAWPGELHGLASSVCPGASWSYQNMDGKASIAFQGRFPDRPGRHAFQPPLRHTSAAGRFLTAAAANRRLRDRWFARQTRFLPGGAGGRGRASARPAG
jgi:hypothetical protein